MSTLSDRINHLLTQRGMAGQSTRQIGEQLGVSRATVSNYRTGKHGINPDEAVLQAWADLLGVPLNELREAAGIPVGLSDPWIPPANANRMTPRQRKAVTEMIESIVVMDWDSGLARRRELAAGYLADPASDVELVTRLRDVGYMDVTKRPRKGSVAAAVWDDRVSALTRELGALPGPG